MFSTHDYSNNRHGATRGSANATLDGFELSLFSGTEGPEIANQLSSAIQITLGRMNALTYLSTPRKNLLAQLPIPKSESAKFRYYEMEERIMERWNKAYWTIRGFFETWKPSCGTAETL